MRAGKDVRVFSWRRWQSQSMRLMRLEMDAVGEGWGLCWLLLSRSREHEQDGGPKTSLTCHLSLVYLSIQRDQIYHSQCCVGVAGWIQSRAAITITLTHILNHVHGAVKAEHSARSRRVGARGYNI